MSDCGESTYTLSGRVVDDRRAPVADVQVLAAATTANGRTALTNGPTATDGTFSLALARADVLAIFRHSHEGAERWATDAAIELIVLGRTGRLHREVRRIRIDQLLGIPSLGDIIIGATTSRFALRVRVVTSGGRPVGNVSVAVRDARRGMTATLGTSTTDGRGESTVPYIAASTGASATDSGQSVRVVISDRGDEIARSAVLFSPAEDAVVDIVVREDLLQVSSEFERLTAALTPILDGAAPTTLTADDLEDVAQRADVDPIQLACYVRAQRLARPGVSAPWFYALLRDELPAALPGLLAASPARWRRALQRALDDGLVPTPTGEPEAAIVAVLDALGTLAAQALLQTDTEGDPRLRRAIDASGVPTATRQAFAQAWLAHDGPPVELWQQLRASSAIPSAQVDALQFSIGAATLVGDHQPALTRLVAERAAGVVTTVRDLAAWSPAQWQALAQAADAPAQIPGATAAERRANYARTLERAIEELAPTPYLAHRFVREAVPQATAAAQFLIANPDFDLVDSIAQVYVEENPASVGTGAPATALVAEIKRVQRVFNVTPRLHRAATTAALLGRGIGSAAEIVRMGFDGFVDTHGAALEGTHPTMSGRALASLVFQRASVRNAFSVTLMAQFGAPFNAIPFNSIAGNDLPGDGPGMATLRTLFGSLDYCACEHCRSVFGPAAYLVDLLSVLGGRPAVNATRTVLDVLRDRRADITGIELSCTNTNTVLPYIDLVLEVLESVARDPDTTLVAYQTRRSAAELRLSPEHHDPAAYAALETDAYPWSLPFSVSTERLRVIMRQLGVPRAEAMAVFAADPSASPTAEHLAETLGMGRGELQIVSDATAFPVAELPAVSTAAAWGLPGIAQWVSNLASDVGRTLDRSALRYEELLALFELDFINPPGAPPVAIAFSSPSCDLDDAEIVNLDAGALDRIHRFVRLWRKRGVSMTAVDRLIRVLGGGALDRDCLTAIVGADAVAARLPAGIEALLVLWQPLDTRNYEGELSPYHRLFVNRQVTPTLDSAFAAASGASEILAPGPLLPSHHPSLRAALRLRAEDLELLIDATLTAPAQRDLASLSILTRHATLARALGVSIAELLQIRSWIAADPFASPADTAAFLDEVERIRASGVDLDALDYVLRHRFRTDAGLHPTDAELGEVLAAIVQAAARIEEALSAVTGDPPQQVAEHLGAVFADPAIVREWVRILGLTGVFPTAPEMSAEAAFLIAHLPAFVPADYAQVVGHAPATDDLVIPSAVSVGGNGAHKHRVAGTMRTKNQVGKRFTRDLALLEFRHRRFHDLRRTFISLAQADGANPGHLESVTHTPASRKAFDLYTSIPWASKCAAVAALRIAGDEDPEDLAHRVLRFCYADANGPAAGAAGPFSVEAPGVEPGSEGLLEGPLHVCGR